jgi:hypothetical protein
MPVPFKAVLELFESHGWHLVRIEKPYRIFWDVPYHPQELPCLIEVDENLEVNDATYRKIKEFFGEEPDEAPES